MNADLTPDEKDYHLGMGVLGYQLDAFWRSDAGVYLRHRADVEYNTALTEFIDCDPTDIKKVMEIQNRMARSKNFTVWITEGINEGLQSKKILEGIEDEAD